MAVDYKYMRLYCARCKEYIIPPLEIWIFDPAEYATNLAYFKKTFSESNALAHWIHSDIFYGNLEIHAVAHDKRINKKMLSDALVREYALPLGYAMTDAMKALEQEAKDAAKGASDEGDRVGV